MIEPPGHSAIPRSCRSAIPQLHHPRSCNEAIPRSRTEAIPRSRHLAISLMSILTRPYRDSDLEVLVRVFTEAVHVGAAAQYDEAQRSAWAPTTPDLSVWAQRFRIVRTIVAELDGQVAGFVSFESNGHIAYLFTAPHATRRGIASTLLARASEEMEAENVYEHFTEASLVARPVFERHGFEVEAEQVVERDGVKMRRFAMRRK